jgi:hypothetical protein
MWGCVFTRKFECPKCSVSLCADQEKIEMSEVHCGVVCLTPALGRFTPRRNSETNSSQGKEDYVIVSTIFRYILILLE